jgi:hypothetical protein
MHTSVTLAFSERRKAQMAANPEDDMILDPNLAISFMTPIQLLL